MSTAAGAGSPGGRTAMLEAVIGYFAANGIGDASLRQIAAAVGTSHRMLIYHFGSREGLLTAVIEAIEEGQRETLAAFTSVEDVDPRELGWRYWQQAADQIHLFGPLYFELASREMHAEDVDAPLRRPDVERWVDALTTMWRRGGELSKAEATSIARLNLAIARGLLHDLLLTGDRRAVDIAMARWDWLMFGGEPHPLPEVRRLTRRWARPA